MDSKQIVIIGSGPAGLAAAIEAGKRGAEVLVVDENPLPGGQLFKQIHKFFGSKDHQAGIRGFDIGKDLLHQAKQYGVEIWLESAVIGIFQAKKLAIEKQTAVGKKVLKKIQADIIINAAGASENAVCFPGWTLPGVMSAGAAQTMINVQRVKPGEKVLMIGSGNVGLIVSYQLLQAGVEVVRLVEAAPRIGGYAVHAAKLKRAGVAINLTSTVLKAEGKETVQSATLCKTDANWKPIPGSEQQVDVDTIAIAAGLKPLIQLLKMQGCEMHYFPELGGWVPLHDQNMETSCSGIYVVGDAAGVEEANTALEEGRLAGTHAAERLGYLSTAESNKIKKQIWERLKSLRMGPFGQSRQQAKELLLQKGEQICRKI